MASLFLRSRQLSSITRKIDKGIRSNPAEGTDLNGRSLGRAIRRDIGSPTILQGKDFANVSELKPEVPRGPSSLAKDPRSREQPVEDYDTGRSSRDLNPPHS